MGVVGGFVRGRGHRRISGCGNAKKGVALKVSHALAHLSRIRFLQGWQLCRWVIWYDIACALIWYDELLSVNSMGSSEPMPLGLIKYIQRCTDDGPNRNPP